MANVAHDRKPALTRRDFLARSLVLGGAAGLAGCPVSFEQGLFNECRVAIERRDLVAPHVERAWEGLRADRVWDCHAHLFGNGHSGQGIYLHPSYEKLVSMPKARRIFFEDAACGGRDEARLDQGIVDRLALLVEGLRPGAKVILLAFDIAYDATGTARRDISAFQIPNEYAARVARAKPQRFEWMASVHPYRPDAVAALEAARRDGARGVKWLPPAMGIDPASPRCDAFYEAMRRLDMPLLVHVGEEQAVQGAMMHPFANPLLLRHPLERGVRVIAAHCGSLGESPDIDGGRSPDKAPTARNIDLFARLMGEARYEALLFGDLSAVTQINRAWSLPLLIGWKQWHHRFLNGSDYPLPGVMPLFSLDALVKEGLLAEEAVPALRELRRANALLFDLVLKRSLRYRGDRFSDTCFETRPFFERPQPGPGPGLAQVRHRVDR